MSPGDSGRDIPPQALIGGFHCQDSSEDSGNACITGLALRGLHLGHARGPAGSALHQPYPVTRRKEGAACQTRGLQAQGGP